MNWLLRYVLATKGNTKIQLFDDLGVKIMCNLISDYQFQIKVKILD